MYDYRNDFMDTAFCLDKFPGEFFHIAGVTETGYYELVSERRRVPAAISELRAVTPVISPAPRVEYVRFVRDTPPGCA